MTKLEAVFQTVLEQEFKDVQIESIKIRDTLDFDEDDVIYVTVVFRSSGRLDSKATAGFLRHVRPKLHEIDEDRFPVMSYVSHDDYQERIAETA